MYICGNDTYIIHIYIYIYIYLSMRMSKGIVLEWSDEVIYVTWREVGGWGRDPKKCTGRDWEMGSSTIR